MAHGVVDYPNSELSQFINFFYTFSKRLPSVLSIGWVTRKGIHW